VLGALQQGSKRLLGAYLQSLLGYPDACTRGEVVVDPTTGEVLAEAPALPDDVLYPKEQALIEHFARRPRRGRMTLIAALQKHGMIGAVDLGPDASTDYKTLVRQAIDAKHGHR